MMRLSTALILVGVTACVYGKKPVPGQHLSKFLNALHVSERAQRAMKYWDNIAEQNVNPSPLYGYPARESNSPEKRYGQNGKKKPSPSPASSHERYTSEERSGDENQEERYPSGYGKPNGYPFPSGKPFTNGPPTGGQPVRNLPEDDDDRDIAQLIHELRQIFEEQYKKNTINSYNSDNTKPTYGPQHTKPTSKVPESDDDDDDDNFTNTHSTRPTDGPITNLKEKTDRRKVAELLGNLSRILKRYNNNDSFTTDSSPTGTPATTESPGDDEDNDRDDDDDIRGLAECWMNDVLGDFFRGFPNGPITNNLTIDGSKVHYILTRAVRQFQLSGGEMDEVLESMIKGLVRAVIIPHKTCPATKFHQVVVWGMNFHMKYHLTNNSGSLKEHFKAIFMNSSFDEKESDQIAGYMVSELQGQLQEQAIHFLKNEFLNDFLDPIGYVVKEMIPMFHAPRNNTHIDVLLHDVEENNPWLLRCITPDRLVAMHHNFVYRLNGFVKQKELYEFLDRAEDTLEEEFLVSTGSEQAPLVKQLINVLEAHIRNVVNSSNVYLQALLSDNANHQTSLLAPIMNPSQQAYFQRIMKSLGPINIGTSSVGPITTGTSTPAPVLPPSAPGKRSASRDKDKWIQRMV